MPSPPLDQGAAALDFRGQFGFGGQAGDITAGEYLAAVVQHGVPGHCVVVVGAQDQPNRRVVIRAGHQVVEHTDVTVHLADVAGSQPPHLQVDQQVTPQGNAVKDEVHIQVIAVKRQAFLPRHKRKPLAQFQQEVPQVRNDRAFQAAFVQDCRVRYVQEFQDVRVFQGIKGIGQDGPGGGTGSGTGAGAGIPPASGVTSKGGSSGLDLPLRRICVTSRRS